MVSRIQLVRHRSLFVWVAVEESLVTLPIREGILAGWYERTEAEMAAKLIGPQDRVLEIGAGLGAVACFIVNRCRPASYFAFEANPRIHILLKETLAVNRCKKVVVRSEVLTDDVDALARGYSPFFMADSFWASSTVEDSEVRAERYEVPTTSFYDVLLSLKPTVTICDIEGGELELFGSASRFKSAVLSNAAASLRAVILELHPRAIGTEGVSEIEATMFDAGFVKRGNAKNGEVVSYVR